MSAVGRGHPDRRAAPARHQIGKPSARVEMRMIQDNCFDGFYIEGQLLMIQRLQRTCTLKHPTIENDRFAIALSLKQEPVTVPASPWKTISTGSIFICPYSRKYDDCARACQTCGASRPGHHCASPALEADVQYDDSDVDQHIGKNSTNEHQPG